MRVAACLLGLLVAGAVAAADPVTMLRDAEARLAAAASPTERLAALGAAVGAHEAALVSLRAALRAMPARERALAQQLGPIDGARVQAVAALYRTLRSPMAARMLHPDGSLSAARATLLLAGMGEALGREQAAIETSLADLAALRRERRETLDALSASLAALEQARGEMAAALDARTRPDPRPADALLALALAESGATLADLAVLIDRLAPEGAEVAVQRAAFDEAVGRLPLPAYGTLSEDGDTLVLDLPAYATARAPWLSTVRHAGPVGLLGEVLVLEPAPGVLISLRGLAAVERAVAEVVGADEPVGHMGGPVPASEEFLIEAVDEAAGAAPQRLYIDVWRDGQAERAASWFDPDA